MKTVALDAMGVLFEAADDVEELLVPFVAENGGDTRKGSVQSAYLRASLGEIGPDEFWSTVGLPVELEDRYLERHCLRAGASAFLRAAAAAGISVWCLSNDVGRWSAKLRTRFELDRYLAGAVISSDVGVRKPDEGIYRAFLKAVRVAPAQVMFFDDREKNVSAAKAVGIGSMAFDSKAGFDGIAGLVFEGAQ